MAYAAGMLPTLGAGTIRDERTRVFSALRSTLLIGLLALSTGCRKSSADIESAYQRCLSKVPPDSDPTQVDIVGGPPNREGMAQHDKHTAALAACDGMKSACANPSSLVCAAELDSHGQ